MELRIPHVMRAPELHPPGHDEHLTVEHARRLLTLTTYRSAKDGRVLMHRYMDLSYAQTDGQGKRLTPIDDVP